MHGSLIALTRAVSPTLPECELSHREREPIDVARATTQHAAYEAALEAAGCRVVRVPAAPDLPDAVFVEDTAVVFDDVTILARPGVASRRPEVDGVAAVLREVQPRRPLESIEAPGTLDGGDVLQVGRDVFVGESSRTNAAGIAQLRAILAPRGYTVRPVPVTGCLHLKTAVTALRDDVLLLNPAWVDPAAFPGVRTVAVDPAEPLAANVLRVRDTLIRAAGHPATAGRWASLTGNAAEGRVLEVDVSELAKAEAGVTCCSVVFQV